jgi:hypothetical protein
MIDLNKQEQVQYDQLTERNCFAFLKYREESIKKGSIVPPWLPMSEEAKNRCLKNIEGQVVKVTAETFEQWKNWEMLMVKQRNKKNPKAWFSDFLFPVLKESK